VTLLIRHLGVLGIFIDLICALSLVSRNKYLENAKDLTSEMKLCQTIKLAYFNAYKKME
jgi:hypothetical protein